MQWQGAPKFHWQICFYTFTVKDHMFYQYKLGSRLPNGTVWFSPLTSPFCSRREWWRTLRTKGRTGWSWTRRGSQPVDSKGGGEKSLRQRSSTRKKGGFLQKERRLSNHNGLFLALHHSYSRRGLDRIRWLRPEIWWRWRSQNSGSISSSLNADHPHQPSCRHKTTDSTLRCFISNRQKRRW